MHQPLLEWLRQEFILAPFEPILHPSAKRIWWSGFSIFVGNAVFAWIWGIWLPQPYENLGLRAVASALGLCLMIGRVNQHPDSRLTPLVFGFVFWLELPVFFTWMYLCNNGSPIWLASVASMVLIYYLVTDWRLATIGTVTGGLLAWVAFRHIGPSVPPLPEGQAVLHAVVIAFAWSVALVLNLSSANLRRAQLEHTLAAVGIMAHELRTPLSTVALLGDALLLEMRRQLDKPSAAKMESLTQRLYVLVRNMNHQIDMQMTNARLQKLPRHSQMVSASKLVTQVVANYPYASSRQRACVLTVIRDEFIFRSSSRLFSQVLDNLIKNAFHSLLAADSRFPEGALRIEVRKSQGKGLIVVADEGMGIEPAMLAQIFKPFFSGSHGAGHGLGLAFCQQVVQNAGGSIHAKSKFAYGATFTIELPLAD